MSGREREKKPDRTERVRRRRRRRAATTMVAVFILVLATVLSLTVFFNITAIEINGESSVYTNEEIMQALKIEAGQNIFLFSTKKAESEITSVLPYLDNVRIVRKLPGTIVIDVTETRTSLALPYTGGCLVLSDGLKILENTAQTPQNLTLVYGIAPNTYKVGAALDTDAEDGTAYLAAVVNALREHDLLGKTTILNVADKLNLSLVYDGRVFVMIGTANNLDYKIRMLETLVEEEIGETETGRLDLSLAGKGIFKAGELELPAGYRAIAQPED